MRTCRLSPARSTGISGIVNITAISRQADTAADIPTIVDIVGEPQTLMTLSVNVIMVRVVIISVKFMVILIVIIC